MKPQTQREKVLARSREADRVASKNSQDIEEPTDKDLDDIEKKESQISDESLDTPSVE